MKLILDPPSGLADSYFDVEFTTSFDQIYDQVIIRLFNDITHDQLDILGISTGYVKAGKEAISKNVSEISGHINIFNNDKMNRMFKAYNFIPIRCEAEITHNDQTHKESEIIEFYNENKSLDDTIIPVELLVLSRNLDIINNEDLNIDIIASAYKKIELCIRSDDSSSECCIQVSCRKGKTSISIPSEFIYYDLNLKENYRKKYKFYYIKYQGTNFSRLGSRQYMLIPNTELEFSLPDDITARPQTRITPTGKLYTGDFILSDRYLVLCPKLYSGFARKTKDGARKDVDAEMLLHESQHMRSLDVQIRQFSSEEQDDTKQKIRETSHMIQEENFRNSKQTRPHINPEQVRLLSSVVGVYNQTAESYKKSMYQQLPANTVAKNIFPNKRTGCAPCSRKSKNA